MRCLLHIIILCGLLLVCDVKHGDRSPVFGKQCNSDHSCFIVQNDSVYCSAGNQACLEQGEGSTDEGAGMGFDDKFSPVIHDNHARYAVFFFGEEKFGQLSHGFIRDYGYEHNHV